MSTFPLRLPEDLKEKASEQAAKVGVSLNQYITASLASQVGAQAEAERYFKARSRRAVRGQAKKILARAGRRKQPRPDDRLDDAP